MLQALDDIDLNDNIPNIDDSDDDEDEVTASGLVISKLRTLVRKIRKSPQMRQKLKKQFMFHRTPSAPTSFNR